MACYLQKLNARKKALSKLEKAVYQETLNNPTIENIDKLNNVRVDLSTVKSRIKNYGLPDTYVEEFYLPNINIID